MKERVIHVKLTSEERRKYTQLCAAEGLRGGDKLRKLITVTSGLPLVDLDASGIVRQIRVDEDTLMLIEQRIPYHGRIGILSQIIRDWINQK